MSECNKCRNVAKKQSRDRKQQKTCEHRNLPFFIGTAVRQVHLKGDGSLWTPEQICYIKYLKEKSVSDPKSWERPGPTPTGRLKLLLRLTCLRWIHLWKVHLVLGLVLICICFSALLNFLFYLVKLLFVCPLPVTVNLFPVTGVGSWITSCLVFLSWRCTFVL